MARFSQVCWVQHLVWVIASKKRKKKRACPGASLQEHLSLEQGLWGLGQLGMVNPPACMVLREFFHTNPTALSSLCQRGFSICEGRSAELCRTRLFPVNSVLCQENCPPVGWCQWLQAFPLLHAAAIYKDMLLSQTVALRQLTFSL